MERRKESRKNSYIRKCLTTSLLPRSPIVREEWARHLNSVSGMDKTIGRVLRQLKKDGLAENTIVMFWR